jgi:hypothetical protein
MKYHPAKALDAVEVSLVNTLLAVIGDYPFAFCQLVMSSVMAPGRSPRRDVAHLTWVVRKGEPQRDAGQKQQVAMGEKEIRLLSRVRFS